MIQELERFDLINESPLQINGEFFSLLNVNPHYEYMLDNLHTATGEQIYTGSNCLIHRLTFPDHHTIIAKSILSTQNEEGNTIIHTPEEEYSLISSLEGYTSFVLPLGTGSVYIPELYRNVDTLFLEDIDGIPFYKALQMHTQGKQSVRWFNSISAQLCAAVDHQIEHGIIHADLGFDNVLITPDNQIKIIDFGRSHYLKYPDEIIQDTVAIGTDYVSPPEQIWGELSAKTDVYAVGIFHAAWLTGSTTADTVDNMSLAVSTGRKISKFSPQLIRTLNKSTVRQLWKEIQQLVHRDPSKRDGTLFPFRRKFSKLLQTDTSR